MFDITFRDGDVLFLAGYTCGRTLEAVAESNAAVTVLVAGPTFDRDYAGLSIERFARTTPTADIQLLGPQGEAGRLLDDGTASFIPSRSPDQTAIVRRHLEQADRVVGACETSPPRDGSLTPGACGLLVPTMLDYADVAIAETNRNAPRLPGMSFRTSRFDVLADATCSLPTIDPPDTDAATERVAGNVTELIPDGATIELGIGRIPAAVARTLEDHTELGLHGGFVSSEVRTLIEERIVTRGSAVADPNPNCPIGRPLLATAVLGPDQEFYEWLEHSKVAELDTLHRTSDPALVGKNPKFTPVNSALQVDIQGQVNAERIGSRQVSMPGGQPAYLRAARRSEGGTSIVALTSTVSDGTSKIVASLPDSAVVTTPRVDVDHVVTELGSASLVGETLVDRTAHLISVAPERERAFLEEAAQQHGLL
jgi:4-hydroxybutyrate CoA-transferase